ncbi:MAG: hypothetical protein ACC628_21020, partial [Pirellulaceae bacterium]
MLVVMLRRLISATRRYRFGKPSCLLPTSIRSVSVSGLMTRPQGRAELNGQSADGINSTPRP